MKMLADKKRIERVFHIGDWVYVKLQLYRQLTMHQQNPKLQAIYFGPFQFIDTMGVVAYKLQLLSDFDILNVFHVSILKPVHALVQASPTLPRAFPTPDLNSYAILERCMVKRHNIAATQLLVQWQGLSLQKVVWVFADEMRWLYSEFSLGDKVIEGVLV